MGLRYLYFSKILGFPWCHQIWESLRILSCVATICLIYEHQNVAYLSFQQALLCFLKLRVSTGLHPNNVFQTSAKFCVAPRGVSGLQVLATFLNTGRNTSYSKP